MSTSTRVLLDEMFHPRITTELTDRGHDCQAVAATDAVTASGGVLWLHPPTAVLSDSQHP